MSTLIEDLLHYATRDAALVVEDFDLHARVDEVVAHYTEHLSPGTPKPAIFIGKLPRVRGDRARITQVLNNLIGNALKYTAPGQPPHLDITAQTITTAAGTEPLVHVQIGDRGIGIPPGQHAAIFTTFHRAHTNSPHTAPASGSPSATASSNDTVGVSTPPTTPAEAPRPLHPATGNRPPSPAPPPSEHPAHNPASAQFDVELCCA